MSNTATLEPSILSIDGTQITYHDSQDSRGHDDVLVLLHGTGGSTTSHFGFLFPILSAKQRVVSIDMANPAHGEALELEDLVVQVAGAIAGILPGRKVVLLGYSLGAVVTAALAARHPELVKRLVLVAGWMKTDLQQQLRNDVWLDLRRSGSQAIRAYSTFCAFGGPFLAEKTMGEIQAGMDLMSFDGFGDSQMDLNRRIDIVADAHRIKAPTLVIGCTHDQMVPIRHQKALFGAIEDSRFAEIPTGHAVVFERPSELCHHIQRFMDAPAEHPAGTVIATPRP
ncbi:alpha/beta fold hydrolase [Paeniglutamicibacter sulfureus]|uniref:Pimeloyl-ACP methyl ester carboxylesterase n=1 Tax=Paeniglutamicibacter sulfureus TaxID=43666 RepID=A0ABU2BJZ4_9MICC|nr:alpha/beta hydrolase [Paeniglutamicibacter sulfureus]MDR7358966.1 pimeloyl-ACP methyl ester carboxylesterase [Paeniglutamicibacter sulfureus]